MSKKRKINLPDANVNITPLLDVLTVLLFFLIKSMTVNSLTLDPPKGVRLPASEGSANVEESIKVAISDSNVLFDNKIIMTLKNKKFEKNEIGADGRTLIPLQKELQKALKKKFAFFKGVGDLSKLPANKVIIQADKELPFAQVKFILHTVASSGYSDYQFVVIPKS